MPLNPPHIRRSFRGLGRRTIISIPWETHADVREKHILQMEMEWSEGGEKNHAGMEMGMGRGKSSIARPVRRWFVC